MVESCGKFIVIRKKGGGRRKKKSHEFSSKPFSRFIFLLHLSWENPSVWLYIYFSVFTCQHSIFVAALNLLAQELLCSWLVEEETALETAVMPHLERLQLRAQLVSLMTTRAMAAVVKAAAVTLDGFMSAPHQRWSLIYQLIRGVRVPLGKVGCKWSLKGVSSR